FYAEMEASDFRQQIATLSPLHFLKAAGRVLQMVGGVLLGPLLTFPLVMTPWMLGDRRIRFLWIAATVALLGQIAEIWLAPHYVAPAVSLLWALSLQGMRHWYVWRPWARPTGQALVGALPLVYLLMAVAGIWIAPHSTRFLPEWPLSLHQP